MSHVIVFFVGHVRVRRSPTASTCEMRDTIFGRQIVSDWSRLASLALHNPLHNPTRRRDNDDAYAMKTSVDSMSCWIALQYFIVSLFGFYPDPITELPIGGSFDRHIQQQFVNSGHQRFQLEEP